MGIFSNAIAKDRAREQKPKNDITEAVADWKRFTYNSLKTKSKFDKWYWKKQADKAKKRAEKANKKLDKMNMGHYIQRPWNQEWVWNRGKKNEVKYTP